MLKSSLLEIIRTFSPKELTKFEDMVISPYFNKNKNLVNLFNVIKPYAPVFEDQNLEKERVWNKMFHDRKYNYGIMKNIIHDLTKLSEKFILLEEYTGDSFRCEYDLIEAANKRNIQKFTSAKIDQFEKKSINQIDPNNYSIIDDYLLINSFYNYTKSSFIHEYNLKQKREDSLRLASEFLLYYFLVNSFKLIHNVIAHETQGNAPGDKTLLEKFFLKLKEHSILEDLLLNESENQKVSKYKEKPLKIVTCFYFMYKSLTSGGRKDDYDKFSAYLHKNIDLFSGFELQNLNNCRITCGINLKTPNLNSAKESIEWYKFLMGKNILAQRNGLITTNTMSNIINLSVKLKELTFAEEFLKKYSVKLPADSRENTYNYCMANIYFEKKEFGKSLECLSKISDEKLLRKYFVKKLYLKIYYELNDYESFIYAFDTFAHFKKRNKLTNEARLLAFNDFGNRIRSLFKLRNSFDKFESEKLRKDFSTNSNKELNWFIEKLEEIKI